MDETTAALRKVFEDMLLETETKIEYYRRMLGKPSVENNTNCVKEIESLKSQLRGKTKENEVLHRKVNDLMLKLSQAYRKRDELAEELRYLRPLLIVPRKVADLQKEVEDLQKKNDELIEQLKNRAILNSVLARKYEKLQIALQSDIGEAFECELDSRPFEKGYYLRFTKEEYELMRDNRLIPHIAFEKRSDK